MATRTYPTRLPREQPPCPFCGESLRAIEWRLMIEREDDGKTKICKYVIHCATDGSFWQWADRMQDDGWQPDDAMPHWPPARDIPRR